MFPAIFRQEKGQAVVELALLLPVLLLIFGGMIEFGRIFHSSLVVTAAGREGARAAAVGHGYDVISEKVAAASPSLSGGDLEVTVEPASFGRGEMVTVTVAYDLDLVWPVINLLLPDPFPVRSSTVMRVE